MVWGVTVEKPTPGTDDSFHLAYRLAERGRYREAFRVLLKAGRRGDTLVFMNLAYAYDVGQGIRQSKRRALHWYRRALASGETSAAHNIATVYRDRHQTARTVRWFRRAIALGDSGSNVDLGQLFLGGMGQPAEALACFRSVGTGESEAAIEAARIWTAVAEGMLAE
jgi:TPR repeat protein